MCPEIASSASVEVRAYQWGIRLRVVTGHFCDVAAVCTIMARLQVMGQDELSPGDSIPKSGPQKTAAKV